MTTEKKPRKPRRNFERELTDVKRYCEISIELMEAIQITSTPALPGAILDHIQGQVSALKAVLARLEPVK